MSWFRIFDDLRSLEAKNLYEYSFSEHTLCVTDVVIGYGGCNAIIVSASEDRTCKVCFALFVWPPCRKGRYLMKYVNRIIYTIAFFYHQSLLFVNSSNLWSYGMVAYNLHISKH